jgi:outer membrane protein assembly factor BamB
MLDWVCACDAPIDCTPARLDDDVVLIGAMDSRVHALRLEDGVRLWETRVGRLSIPSIVCPDERTIVTAAGVKAHGRGVVAILNPADGAVEWTWNAPGTVIGPLGTSGTRVLCTSRVQRNGEVTCIECRARRPVVWRAPLEGWPSGVRLHQDVVFAPCMDHRMYCLDVETGERRWTFEAKGLICALPLVHRRMLYFGAHDGVFYALSPDGALLWRAELADRVSGEAAAEADLVIFGGWDNHVRALHAETGEEVWSFDAGAPIVATPVVVDGTVYIGTDGGQLLSLDSRSGQRLDVFPRGDALEREIKTAPLVAGDQLIVGSHDGGVFALRLRVGESRLGARP